MSSTISRILLLILLGIIIFLLISFVGKRNEYGYIGPDTSDEGYRALMSGLDSWSGYMSGNSNDLSKTQQYFRWAVDNNRDSVLGKTLARNINKVDERSQLETIQQCVTAVRKINQTWNDIDSSYDKLFALLQDQITLVPTVLLSMKNFSTIKCVKDYVDHVKATSIVLVETSQSWGKEKQAYEDEINNYPRALGTCERILLIQAQSLKLKQDLATMIFDYEQYRDILNDPARHATLCQQQYSNTLSQDIATLTKPTLRKLDTSIDDAIAIIKGNMQAVASGELQPRN